MGGEIDEYMVIPSPYTSYSRIEFDGTDKTLKDLIDFLHEKHGIVPVTDP